MSDDITFVAHHQPPLQSGNYTLTVNQELAITGETIGAIPSKTQKFVVSGERCTLQPEDIGAVFPSDGSFGDYSAALPHILLNRSTLPWEREAVPGSTEIPWLTLLLFDEKEKPTPKIVTWGDMLSDPADAVNPYSFDTEYGQQDDDRLTVIEAPKSVLETILPTQDDLKWMAHVRQSFRELAVVMGNRLPKSGGSNTVHLVSLETFYRDDNTAYDDADADQNIRLISLKSWTFANEDASQTLEAQLKGLNTVSLRMPDLNTETLDSTGLSDALKTSLDHKAKAGKKLFLHHYPGGSTGVSWYRGPLTPVAGEAVSLTLPTDASDKLLRYDDDFGALDTSYAAAWELGRQLALQSKAFAAFYYTWKQNYIRYDKQQQQERNALHPYKKAANSSSPAMPDTVKAWLGDLHLLRSIPFHYLVPDERMLPPGSIAFFTADEAWMKSILDGACSISRITDEEVTYAATLTQQIYTELFTPISGVLVRSGAVSGWKDLLVEANVTIGGATQSDQPPLRLERLAPDILIVLFEGEIQQVKFHHPPDVLHFGFERADAGSFRFSQLSKKLRYMTGESTGAFYPKDDAHHITSGISGDDASRKVDINALATTIAGKFSADSPSPLRSGKITTDQFAFQMVETVPVVVFEKSN